MRTPPSRISRPPGKQATSRRIVRAIVLVLFVAAVTVPAAHASAASDLDYPCHPPTPPAAANCDAWHTSPVQLNWIFDRTLLSVVPGSDCADRTVASDTAGATFTCSVTSLLTGELTKTATVRLDQTPPTITGVAPDRPPDHNGWDTRPGPFQFAGADATSGLAGCDSILYSGPDDPTARVQGACRDIAGNSASDAAPLKYDA